LVALYLQIILGALVRHLGATWAAGMGPTAALLGVDPATHAPILWSSEPMAMLNMLHRYAALAVSGLIALSGVLAFARRAPAAGVSSALVALLPTVVVVLQVIVGIGMIAMSFRLEMRTAHLALAALALAAQFLLVLRLATAVRHGAACVAPPAAAPRPALQTD
jgi:heme A synthase